MQIRHLRRRWEANAALPTAPFLGANNLLLPTLMLASRRGDTQFYVQGPDVAQRCFELRMILDPQWYANTFQLLDDPRKDESRGKIEKRP